MKHEKPYRQIKAARTVGSVSVCFILVLKRLREGAWRQWSNCQNRGGGRDFCRWGL